MNEILKVLVCGLGSAYLLIRFFSSLRTLMNRSGYVKTRSNLGIWSVRDKYQAQATIQEELELPTRDVKYGTSGVRR